MRPYPKAEIIFVVIYHEERVLSSVSGSSSWFGNRIRFIIFTRCAFNISMPKKMNINKQTTATSVVSHWFKNRRSYAIGVVISGSSLGGVIFPIMLNRLIVEIGFASGVRATAYLILGCLVTANALIAPRLPPHRLRPVHLQMPKPDMKRILTHRAYQLAVLGGFFTTWGFFLSFFYIQSRHQDNHSLFAVA